MLIQQIVDFSRDPNNAFWSETAVSLELSFIPALIALVISVPLGLLVAQRPFFAFLATNVTGLARAIPTLAFLAAVYPYLGFGFTPSLVALTLIGIPPILLNTVAGLRGVDPAAVDAARGVGMTRLQIFTRVEMPLALPVIAAGVRTATVQIVATVPIAALVGGRGWGDYVLRGAAPGFTQLPALIIGVTLIAALALITEVVLARVQYAVTPRGVRMRAALEPATTTAEQVPAVI